MKLVVFRGSRSFGSFLSPFMYRSESSHSSDDFGIMKTRDWLRLVR